MIGQIVKFGAVGIVNTLANFAIFNLLVVVFGLPILLSNICAVTIVMAVSLQLNRQFVFKTSDQKSYASHVARFVVVTVFGQYFIQNAILLGALSALQGMSSLTGIFANQLVQANIAKIIGVGASAVWNFVLYKFWVFAPSGDQAASESESDE